MILAIIIGLILVPVAWGLWREYIRQSDPMRKLSDEHVLRYLNTTIDRPRRERRGNR